MDKYVRFSNGPVLGCPVPAKMYDWEPDKSSFWMVTEFQFIITTPQSSLESFLNQFFIAFRIGLAKRMLGNYSEARMFLERALRIEPTNSTVGRELVIQSILPILNVFLNVFLQLGYKHSEDLIMGHLNQAK